AHAADELLEIAFGAAGLEDVHEVRGEGEDDGATGVVLQLAEPVVGRLVAAAAVEVEHLGVVDYEGARLVDVVAHDGFAAAVDLVAADVVGGGDLGLERGDAAVGRRLDVDDGAVVVEGAIVLEAFALLAAGRAGDAGEFAHRVGRSV